MTSSEQAAASSPAFHSQYRVVIVGAGLVGLLLAIVLRRADYHVVVIDKDSKLKEVSPALAIPYRQFVHLFLTDLIATPDWGRHHSTCKRLSSTGPSQCVGQSQVMRCRTKCMGQPLIPARWHPFTHGT